MTLCAQHPDVFPQKTDSGVFYCGTCLDWKLADCLANFGVTQPCDAQAKAPDVQHEPDGDMVEKMLVEGIAEQTALGLDKALFTSMDEAMFAEKIGAQYAEIYKAVGIPEGFKILGGGPPGLVTWRPGVAKPFADLKAKQLEALDEVEHFANLVKEGLGVTDEQLAKAAGKAQVNPPIDFCAAPAVAAEYITMTVLAPPPEPNANGDVFDPVAWEAASKKFITKHAGKVITHEDGSKTIYGPLLGKDEQQIMQLAEKGTMGYKAAVAKYGAKLIDGQWYKKLEEEVDEPDDLSLADGGVDVTTDFGALSFLDDD
jgi:hypothetical protein